MKTLTKALILVTSFTFASVFVIFLVPTRALCMQCTAGCGGGTSVSCGGHSCESTPNQGCIGYNAEGGIISIGACY
jgi:hypothetical protein